jgi:hypothetical protein
VSLGQSNNTGKVVDIEDMDYFVSSDARLGGTTDKWIALGTQSHNRDYYELWAVIKRMWNRRSSSEKSPGWQRPL